MVYKFQGASALVLAGLLLNSCASPSADGCAEGFGRAEDGNCYPLAGASTDPGDTDLVSADVDTDTDSDTDTDTDTDADADADADADTDSDADTDTGTTPGTSGLCVGVTTGFARVVHLVGDGGSANIHLNGNPTPLNPTPIPAGGNTDTTGIDYAPFPPSDYTVEVRATSGAWSVDIDPLSVALCEYTTVLAYGSLAAGAVVAALGPNAMEVVDDVSAAAPGTHRLTVFHLAPGTPDVDVWLGGGAVGTPMASGMTYGAWSTLLTSAGATTLYLDTTADGVADESFDLDLADGGWSYVYLMVDASLVLPFGLALHHVRATDTQPVPPN